MLQNRVLDAPGQTSTPTAELGPLGGEPLAVRPGDELRQGWIDMLVRDGFSPVAMLSGTYDNRWDLGLGEWQVQKHYSQLVRYLNRLELGSHFHRVVGRSYFGSFMVVEWQRRGMAHMHALVDRRVDFSQAIKFWGDRFGYLDCRPVVDVQGVLEYVGKYLLKGDREPLYWPRRREWESKSEISSA